MNRAALTALLFSVTAVAAEPIELSSAVVKAMMAKNDEEALQECQRPRPVDYDWVLNVCMKMRHDAIEQTDDMRRRPHVLKEYQNAKSASGGPSGTLGEARDAGGKALPAPQAESD